MASSSNLISFKYDVFLSFRGKDTRNSFVSHLYSALQQQGIDTFKDDKELRKGKRIDSELIKSIQQSKFHIIVFSKNYASSSWCLDELVNIMKCQKQAEQRAYPVFYDVAPSDVRKQKGPVEVAFARHEKEVAAGKWRKALKNAAGLAGWELNPERDQAEFIKQIVEYISLELRSINEYVDKRIIGMEARVKKVLASLETGFEDVRMIGIKGIGGGGKTTLAKAVFDQISAQFEGKSFVENISEVSKASLSSLHWLPNQVISDVLKDKISLKSYEGKSQMKKMKGVGKVLIVLDDVDDIRQIDSILAELTSFKPGSRIIITTRDEQVLKSLGVSRVHNIDLLSNEEATSLLSRYAFRTDIPKQGYEELSRRAVYYAAGLPLLITVLGSFLCGRDKADWEDQLDRLKAMPLNGTLEKLELSYISLEDDLKEIFLDIACFMKGSKKDHAIRILESCGFHAKIGLRVLEQKSLITISDDHILGMHDRIQEMGRDIVRRLDRDQPKRHSRLWIRREIEGVLADRSGTDVTRAIAVDDSRVELSSEIVTKGFENVERLRFLRLVSEMEDDYSCWNERIDQFRQNFPCTLRYLSWESYPYWSLPHTFQADNLVALEMSDCRIVQLWKREERKVLNNLRFLDLSRSELKTLDLDLMPNLEKLDLEECRKLENLHTPIGCLKRLVSLNLNGCSKIKSISFVKQLETLMFLFLDRLKLKEVTDVIPGQRNNSLLELRLRYNDIQELPSSIENFRKLVNLDLHSCRDLRSLPGSICRLRHLKYLKLYGCNLVELPVDIGLLKDLEKLDLSQTSVKHLPDSISRLKHLKTLNLTCCWKLERLPEDLGLLKCLENLILTECEQVGDIPDSICELKKLKCLNIFKCIEIKKLPEELGLLKSLEVLNIEGTSIRRLPESISSSETLKIYADEQVFRSHGYASTSITLKASSSTRKRKFHKR